MRGGRQLAGIAAGAIASQPASVDIATVGACPGKPPQSRLLIRFAFCGVLLLFLLGYEDVAPRPFDQHIGHGQIVAA